MLKHLTVQDLALVAHLDVDLNPGLTVITGESGAGKSILLAALSLVLGERATSDLLRPGAPRADVSAVFDVSGLAATQAKLREHELDADDGECLVRRTIAKDGRSRAFVNGVPVTVQVLRDIAGELVDIHGQHENLRLAQRATQLAIIDAFAGCTQQRLDIQQTFNALTTAQKTRDELQQSLDAARDRAELAAYQLQELDALDLAEGEFENIELEHKRLSQVEHLQSLVANAQQALEADAGLGQAVSLLQGIDDHHASLVNARAALVDALALVEDASGDLRRYSDTLESDPERLADIDDRLGQVHDLARKHKVAPEEVAALANQLRGQLDAVAGDTSELEQLNATVDDLHNEFNTRAKALSTKRKAGAKKFAKAIAVILNQLGLAQASLECRFEKTTNHAFGTDSVEFWVTTNPKYPAGPLNKIASGGELARISLAIQVAAAKTSQLPTLVLDEADVGVGGKTADTVGRLLRDLGLHTQVLCVTHAPQVAALGQHHLKVSKTGDQDTELEPLAKPARLQELARMLAGSDITRETKEYAASLLADA